MDMGYWWWGEMRFLVTVEELVQALCEDKEVALKRRKTLVVKPDKGRGGNGESLEWGCGGEGKGGIERVV